jgi:hypothetical protein
MRRDGGGVQFFDLVEVDWKSEHAPVANGVANSGCTGGAMVYTCTAAPGAGARVGAGPPGSLAAATAPATRGGRITGTTSARCERDAELNAWGIMVPKS